MGGTQSFPKVSITKDHIVIVTGSNTGIGYETAKWIAMMGATVILACRSEEKARQAIEQMNDEYQELKRKGTDGLVNYDSLSTEFMKLDNASLKSVKSFIDDFKASGRKLHTLICNAGIGYTPNVYTEDGHLMVFQVNYLSHFLITALLLPIMENSGEDTRIVNVSSFVHTMTTFDEQVIEPKQGTERYDPVQEYSRSKLYQVMQMYALNRRIRASGGRVTVTALSPGLVETNMFAGFKGANCMMGCFMRLLQCCGMSKKPNKGAWTSINAAVNPDLKGVRDTYYDDSKPKETTADSRDETKQEILWKYTLECLKDYLTDDDISYMERKK